MTMKMSQFKRLSKEERREHLASGRTGAQLISQIDRESQTFIRRYCPTIGGILIKPLPDSGADDQGFFPSEEEALEAARNAKDRLYQESEAA